MSTTSLIRERAREWIERLPVGTVFHNDDLYRYLSTHYPAECSAAGDAENEPVFHNRARWAIQWAKGGKGGREEGIVRDIGRGRHQRVAPFR